MNLSFRLMQSWQLLVAAWRFLLANKDLIILPVVSIVAAIGFFVVTAASAMYAIVDYNYSHNSDINMAVIIAIFAAIYFCLSFIAIFFNAAFVACVTARLKNQPLSILGGLAVACNKAGNIFAWSVISSTVGVIVSALINTHSIVEKIVVYIVSVSWSLATYFMIPILVNENIGPIKAIKKSAALFGNNWRRVVSVSFILSLFFMVLIFGTMYLIAKLHIYNYTMGLILATIIVSAILVNMTFNTIVNSVLYIYHIANVQPAGFDRALIDSIFVKKKK